MLPRRARLHESADFRRVTRSGVRAGRPTLVVHAAAGAADHSRVGFVVSKAVGGAVVRNRVRRRLRHLAADRLRTPSASTGIAAPELPQDFVVRALPASATDPARVAHDLEAAWSQVRVRLSTRLTRTAP